jgi:hypothetical protein
MLNHLDPASALAIALLVFALILVIRFEATNGRVRPGPQLLIRRSQYHR